MKRLHLFVMVSLVGLFLSTSGTYLPPSSACVAQSQSERKEVKVWVNTSSRVYHCPGTRWYGSTKHGKYVGECAAIQDGNRPAYGKACGSDCQSGQTTAPASSPSAEEKTAPAQQAGNPDAKVWVNTNSGVYHCPGTRWYGSTKQGEYMTQKKAREGGYRPAYGKVCQ
ncbi:MAG: hypothetical protein DMG38_16005 [Acidobacteria bacterium]|nr:MAG: hypothetical protein DMG38_16005 [Acidobacteriota bacterium]